MTAGHPAAAPVTVRHRIALVTSIVSGVNLLVFAVVGMGLSAVNTFRLLVVVPAWYFIAFATVMLAVLLISWPRGNRELPPRLTKAPGWSLGSGTLTIFSLFAAVILYGTVRYYDPIVTVFGAYSIAGWICIAAGILGYLRLQFDPPPVTIFTALLSNLVPNPSRFARVLSWVSDAAFVAMVAFCIVVVPLEQSIYLGQHGGAVPRGSGGAEALWLGHFPPAAPTSRVPHSAAGACRGVLRIVQAREPLDTDR